MDDESESTDRWAVPEAIGREVTPAPRAGVGVGVAKSPGDRHKCRTVASPIPAMLAETMGLANEKEVAPQPPEGNPPRR